MNIGGVDSKINSTIGERQGSCEGTVLFLFLFMMQAAMETLIWPEGASKPEFMTQEYGKTTGDRYSMHVHLIFGLLSLQTTACFFSDLEAIS